MWTAGCSVNLRLKDKARWLINASSEDVTVSAIRVARQPGCSKKSMEITQTPISPNLKGHAYVRTSHCKAETPSTTS